MICSAKIYNKFDAVTKNYKIFRNAFSRVHAIKKAKSKHRSMSWGRVDSNHRTDSRTDLQSVAIATMRLPQE